jgi:hypothetical protein
VLDDLERQVKLNDAANRLRANFDGYVGKQIAEALDIVDGKPFEEALEALENESWLEPPDSVNQLAESIERELSQVWLPKGETCTTHAPTL